MLDVVDPIVLVFVAVQAILLAILAAQAVHRGRQLERVTAATRDGTEAGGEDPVSAVLRLRDRAERLAFELDLQRQDAIYLADLIGAGIVHLDDELRVDRANAAAHVFLERAPGAMVGRSAIEAFVDVRIESIVAAARERGAATGEVVVRDPDGPTLVVRARRSPIRGVWVVLEDVAELRRLQRIRSEFIDNLSHELRTPLTTVGLLAEGLSRDTETAGAAIPPKMRERVRRLEIETGHLSQMVNELLELTRIEGGGGQLHLDDVDLGRLATASVDRLRLFGERHGIQFQVDAPARSPAVRGDADRLSQVFVNLLHNAVKFSPNGGTVTVTVRAAGSEVVASVADQGIGIPEADRARVFERFYKVDRARGRGGGTGLGLAIARHLVEGHGGRIWLESEEGAGSTFSFALPMAPAPPTLPPAGPASPTARSGRGRGLHRAPHRPQSNA
jgi:two-component system phosphate regulon sensor histidine kinase PhoR